MKKFFLTLLVCICFMGGTAQAHVLIADDGRRVGAVLHITPDDDPIAGEPSTISFSIQDKKVSQETHAYTLTVKDDQGGETYIPMHVNGSTVNASYVFRSQGVYHLTLTMEPLDGSKDVVVFRHAQRISRGEAATNSKTAAPMWARMGVVSSISGLLVIGFVAFNKRKVLTAYARERKF